MAGAALLNDTSVETTRSRNRTPIRRDAAGRNAVVCFIMMLLLLLLSVLYKQEERQREREMGGEEACEVGKSKKRTSTSCALVSVVVAVALALLLVVVVVILIRTTECPRIGARPLTRSSLPPFFSTIFGGTERCVLVVPV